jgi:hypothetical protein
MYQKGINDPQHILFTAAVDCWHIIADDGLHRIACAERYDAIFHTYTGLTVSFTRLSA